MPPEPRPNLLTRPRLLREMVGRFEHRVTSVVGGPGLGKTTLLAQAIAENQMAPRGVDVWIGLEQEDADADRLGRVVAAAFTAAHCERPTPPLQQGFDDTPLDPAAVADAVWSRSPTEACVVLDDVHLLPPRSEEVHEVLHRRVLELWRGSGEPAFLLRLDGQAVHLVTGEHLGLDVDDFDHHLAAAASADTDGTPSLALDHLLTAVERYRDHLHLDLPEADWFALDREHYRTRFVAAAIRAGQLLLGRAELDRAQTVAYRALAADPWSEDASAVLVGSALARGDRSGALRLLDRCLAALDDLGVGPSEATQQLRRRVHGIAPD